MENSQISKNYKRYLGKKKHKLEKAKNLKKHKIYKTYNEYLLSKEWKRLRNIKLNQVGYRCQICNKKDVELHVHHRTYARIFHESLMDLTVLCKGCHSTYHQIIYDNNLSESDAEIKVEMMMKEYLEKNS